MIPKIVSSIIDALRGMFMFPIVAFVDCLKGLLRIPAVWIDGGLYVNLGLFAFLQPVFAGEEAARFIEPQTLFWVKTVIGSLSATCLALKMFRSNSQMQHPPANPEEAKPGEGVTQYFANPNPPPKDK